MIEKNLPAMSTLAPGRACTTKPCECGRKGCIVSRRDYEGPTEFRDRKYRDADCYRAATNAAFADRDKARQQRAIDMKLANPGRSYASIAAELRMDKDRCRNVLVEAGAMKPRLATEQGTMEAPAWYERPCGRVQALRAAHGIAVS